MVRNLLLTGIATMFILAACATPQGAPTNAPSAMADHASTDSAGTMAEGEMKESDAMATDDMEAGDTMAEGDMKESDAMATSDTEAGDTMAEGDMKTGDAMATDDTEAGDTMAEGDMKESDAMLMVELPAWAALSLTDAHTGEPFTLADFAGKTVFVEPMATWCTNCRAQLNNVKDAKAQLGNSDVVFVALSVETTLEAAVLAAYADEHGFDWVFAVATPDLLQQLAGDFGQTIANPPATPHFIISPDGTVSELTTGIESAEAILAKVQG